jgi:hypothetical protein
MWYLIKITILQQQNWIHGIWMHFMHITNFMLIQFGEYTILGNWDYL